MPKRKKRLPASELSGLCMQLALLYEAGMMLDDGLETLAEENGAEDSVYAALCAAVSQSGSLPEAPLAFTMSQPNTSVKNCFASAASS